MVSNLASLSAVALSPSIGSIQSPWWGAPVLAGAFTILGASLSQIATLLLDRARARRDNETRWHSVRFENYSTLLAEIDKINYRLNLGPKTIDIEQLFDNLNPIALKAILVSESYVAKAIDEILRALAFIAYEGLDHKDAPKLTQISSKIAELRRLMRSELGI